MLWWFINNKLCNCVEVEMNYDFNGRFVRLKLFGGGRSKCISGIMLVLLKITYIVNVNSLALGFQCDQATLSTLG